MEYLQIGYFLKPSGIDGYIKVNIEEDYLDDFMDSAHVFSLIRGDYVPFFIDNIEDTHHTVVKFEDFASPEGVVTLSNKAIYLASNQLTSNTGQFKSKVHHWVGYEIIMEQDGQSVTLGIIKEMFQLPTQYNAVLDYNDKEIQIPMVQSFIVSINDSEKQISMVLPEGLLDI